MCILYVNNLCILYVNNLCILEVQYKTVEELYKALIGRQIDVMMLDVFRLGIYKDTLGNSRLRMSKIINNNMAYGVVFNLQSEVLTQCIVKYTKSKQAEIYEKVNNSISVAEVGLVFVLSSLSLFPSPSLSLSSFPSLSSFLSSSPSSSPFSFSSLLHYQLYLHPYIKFLILILFHS